MIRYKLLAKLDLLKEDIFDLNNADFKQIKDIALLDKVVKEKATDKKVAMSSRDLAQLVYNTQKKLNEEGKEEYYLLDHDSLCRLVNDILAEIQLQKENAIAKTKEEIMASVEMPELKGLNEKQQLDVLKLHAAALEEELHRMILAKTVIVPTEDFYKTKCEYDSMRHRLNVFTRERDEEAERALKAEKRIGNLEEQVYFLCQRLSVADAEEVSKLAMENGNE